MSTSSENLENTCVVCFKNVTIYSIGECDHPVCFECSTRMRVLCRQNECPICRQDMPKVIFTKEVQPFRNIKNNNYLMDKKFKICFDSAEIQAIYSRLLEHVCTNCPTRPAFRTFQNLKDHMRKEHEMYYCDLCVENLKIFTAERRCYTRSELALHRRKGDPDDRSHRGHPLCEFCDQRYMDNDELFRHLRRDHLFCHFCDADGFHQYYSSYDYLRDHFRFMHFLCEEGGCMDEKFTSVFRTEIDLKAHRASVHGRTIGKAAVKQARMLELEFTLAPRPHDCSIRSGRRRPGRRRGRQDDEDQCAIGGDYEDGHMNGPSTTTALTTTVFRNAPHINTDCIEEFPTLGGEAPPQRTSSGKVAVNNSGVTIRTVRHSQHPLAITDENFPALGPDGGCNTVRLSVNSTTQDRSNLAGMGATRGATPKAPTNVSIHVNHRPSGSSQNIRIRPTSSFHDDFPTLSGAKASNPVSSVHWLGNPANTGAKSKTQPQQQASSHQFPKAPTSEDFPSLSSKFSAGCSMNNTTSASNNEGPSKKASLMIPVTSSWASSHNSSGNSKGHIGDQNSNGIIVKQGENDESSFASTGSLGNIKVKSKKKKSKNIAAGSISNNDSPLSTKSSGSSGKDAGGTEGGKKKKKHQVNSDSETSNKISQSGGSIVQEKENEKSTKNESKKGQVDVQERKRSELLIASLSNQETSRDTKMEKEEKEKKNKFTEERHHSFSSDISSDFPAINDARNLPPGFTKGGRTTIPPPGFGGGNNKAPPPGFSVTLNSVARPKTNDLTFTNSSGQSYCILPNNTSNTNYVYAPPQDFARRNQALVNRVKKTLASSRAMEDFCQVSKMFRQGDISASDFYARCRETMGEKTFADIFPELLVLLPDIAKQQELWDIHTQEESSVHGFKICTLCQQVLALADLNHHVGSHTLENHFPALGVSENTSQAWGKK